jgi:hypothetical protein
MTPLHTVIRTGWAGRALCVCLCLWGMLGGTSVWAQGGQPVPVTVPLAPLADAHRVVLRVQSPQGMKTWTLAQLEALGLYRVSTATFWPDDDGHYQGPLLAQVLDASGLKDATALRIKALDGFSQVMPREDWTRWPVVLATRRDDAGLSTRHKGPVRVIYPRDMDAQLADPLYRLRWVWLVSQIEPVKP